MRYVSRNFLHEVLQLLKVSFFQPQNKNYKVTLMDQGKNFLQAS